VSAADVLGFRTWFRNRLDREDTETLNGRVRRTLAGWRSNPPAGTSAAFFDEMMADLDKHMDTAKPEAAPKPSDVDVFL
jgi:hypothetical protein